jgi:sirohydrochlorin cobaltochelatase
MNCLLCRYRERIIGHEAAVGAPQAAHHHHVEGIGTDASHHHQEHGRHSHHHGERDHHYHRHGAGADGATRPTEPAAVR